MRKNTEMDAKVLEFLQVDRHAILATKGRNGAPQLTPVWFLFLDGVLLVSVQTSTVKLKNLRRDPTVSVCIEGGRDDARYVVLSGKAELIEPGEQERALRWKIVRHYYADEGEAKRYNEMIKERTGVIITLRAERMVLSGFAETES